MKQSNDIVFSPSEVASLGQKYLEYRRDHKSSSLPFPSLKFPEVYPMFPGELMSIIARPGHAKTGLMMYWARKRADWLRVNEPNRMSIYATWEQSVEELHTFYIAADQHLSVTKMAKAELTTDDWTKAITASAKRVSEPLWFIGHSVMRRTGRATIGVDLLAEAISKVIDMGFEVDSLFADYLQRMALPKGMDNPVIGYSRTLDDLKNLALGFGIPVIVGVQASRDVEDTSKGKDKLPIPEINHGQWTSNVEQSSDRVLSLVRPRRYRKEGEMFGDMKVVGHNQLLISVLKQKLGEGNVARWVSFNPVYNVLDAKELENPVPDA